MWSNIVRKPLKGKAVSGSEKKQAPAIDKIEEENYYLYWQRLQKPFETFERCLSSTSPNATFLFAVCCLPILIQEWLPLYSMSKWVHQYSQKQTPQKLMLDNSCNLMEFLRHFWAFEGPKQRKNFNVYKKHFLYFKYLFFRYLISHDFGDVYMK